MKLKFSRKLDELNRWRKQKISNRNFLIVLSVLVGVFGGLAAAFLKGITHFIASKLQDDIEWHFKYSFYLIFPLIGIFLSVLYVRKFLKGKKFETGITPIIYAISRKKSRIEIHNIYSQIVTTALTIGFGGSSGMEAPIAYSGSAIGSNVARFFGLDYKEITLLLACGAAAGISGAFNSPVAGVVFAIEILLPEFSIPIFIPLLISSALAAVISKLLYSEPLFFTAGSEWEIGALTFYILLSIVVGLYTVYFTQLSSFFKNKFKKIKSDYNKVWISGISLGLLIFIFPALYGEGYLTIQSILDGNFDSIVKNSLFADYRGMAWVVIAYTVLTIFAKSIAALFTLSAGGNGGIFGPSLVMGGLIGFVFAYSMNQIGFVQLNVPNFVMAGMAGALSGVLHAPLTGIFLIAEITGGYTLMVPLMLVSSLSYLINRGVMKHSIYTKALAESGDLLTFEDKDRVVLRMMKLRNILENNFVVLRPWQTPVQRKKDIIHSKRNIFPVVNDDGDFMGILYIENLLSMLIGEEPGMDKTFEKLRMKPNDIIVDNENMDEVMSKMNREDVWILPVVDENNKYLGFISKSSVFNKYRTLLINQGAY